MIGPSRSACCARSACRAVGDGASLVDSAAGVGDQRRRAHHRPGSNFARALNSVMAHSVLSRPLTLSISSAQTMTRNA